MIIKNCKIISNKGFEEKDIRTDKGIIVKIEDEIRAKTGEEVIEAKGRYILPGFIDIHTHLDDTIGKYKLADDFRTGSMIAALNGITSVYNFITERTDRPLKYAIEEFKRKGEKSVVNYGFHLTPVNFSPADLDYIKRTIENGFTSFKFYTTYKNAGIFISYEDIERVVKKIKTDKTLFLIHCEDEEILSRYYCYQYSEPYDHLRYRPSEAESEAVRKILSIAETTGARFHIVHCSSKESAELIRNGRNNSKITVETCPQYLILSAEHLRKRDGHRFFCTPPLREKENMMTLRKMAQSGFFDIFTTDHAPFKRKDKDENRKNLRSVPNGLPGLGALPHIIYRILRNTIKMPFSELAKRLSENPARIMNIFPQKGVIREGSDADIIIVSESDRLKRILPSLADTYNPYRDLSSNLRFDYVIIGGVVVAKNSKIINNKFRGRCLNVIKKSIQK